MNYRLKILYMYVIDINYSCLPKRYVPYDSLPL